MMEGNKYKAFLSAAAAALLFLCAAYLSNFNVPHPLAILAYDIHRNLRSTKYAPLAFNDPKSVNPKADVADVNSWRDTLTLAKLTSEQSMLLDSLQRMEYSRVNIIGGYSETGDFGMSTTTKKGVFAVYIYNPKTGSSAVRNAMKPEGIMMKKAETRKSAGVQDSFVFTTIRHPEERLVSAYGTLLNRYSLRKGKLWWAHEDHNSGSVTHDYLPMPQSPTDIQSWKLHFQDSLHMWLKTVNNAGWDNPSFSWNIHLIPQIDHLRGYNISYIACSEYLSGTLTALGLRNPGRRNRNEHAKGKMPTTKFQSFDLLRHETKELVRKLYHDDYALYNTFCGKRDET